MIDNFTKENGMDKNEEGTLNENVLKLSVAMVKPDDMKSILDMNKKEFDDGKPKPSIVLGKLDEMKSTYDMGKQEWVDGKPKPGMVMAKPDDMKSILDMNKQELDDGKPKPAIVLEKLDDMKSTYDMGKQEESVDGKPKPVMIMAKPDDMKSIDEKPGDGIGGSMMPVKKEKPDKIKMPMKPMRKPKCEKMISSSLSKMINKCDVDVSSIIDTYVASRKKRQAENIAQVVSSTVSISNDLSFDRPMKCIQKTWFDSKSKACAIFHEVAMALRQLSCKEDLYLDTLTSKVKQIFPNVEIYTNDQGKSMCSQKCSENDKVCEELDKLTKDSKCDDLIQPKETKRCKRGPSMNEMYRARECYNKIIDSVTVENVTDGIKDRFDALDLAETNKESFFNMVESKLESENSCSIPIDLMKNEIKEILTEKPDQCKKSKESSLAAEMFERVKTCNAKKKLSRKEALSYKKKICQNMNDLLASDGEEMQTIELGCELQCVKAKKSRCTEDICNTAYEIVDSAKSCFKGKACEDASVDGSETLSCVQPLVKKWNTVVKPELDTSEELLEKENRKRRSLSNDILDELMEFESVVENLETAATSMIPIENETQVLENLQASGNTINSGSNPVSESDSSATGSSADQTTVATELGIGSIPIKNETQVPENLQAAGSSVNSGSNPADQTTTSGTNFIALSGFAFVLTMI